MCRATDGPLLTGKQDVLGRFSNFSFLNHDGHQVDVLTLEEVKKGISTLKNNKTPGPDNIPAELLKHGGEELAKVMHEIVVET